MKSVQGSTRGRGAGGCLGHVPRSRDCSQSSVSAAGGARPPCGQLGLRATVPEQAGQVLGCQALGSTPWHPVLRAEWLVKDPRPAHSSPSAHVAQEPAAPAPGLQASVAGGVPGAFPLVTGSRASHSPGNARLSPGLSFQRRAWHSREPPRSLSRSEGGRRRFPGSLTPVLTLKLTCAFRTCVESLSTARSQASPESPIREVSGA